MNVWLEGLQVSLIGMVVVFVGLVLLIFLISLTRAFSGGNEKPAPKAAVPVVEAPKAVPMAPVHQGEDSQVVAVITAALAAMYQQQHGSSGGFIVRRIKRT